MEKRFIAENIIEYCVENSTQLPEKTKNILFESMKLQDASKVIGSLPSFIMRFILLTKKPKKILEIGTFTGFTLSLFDEYTDNGTHITSLEEDPTHYKLAYSKFGDIINAGKITLINNEGIAYLENCETLFDFIFIDARKEVFYNKIDLILEKLEEEGVLIVDNALAGLSVFNPIKPWQTQTVDFNEKLAKDNRFIVTILPLRDGFTLAIKK